ncbi:MAG: hypothetical protein NXI31_00615 [bacterium]|nr:hypothetical protein [bacterium]
MTELFELDRYVIRRKVFKFLGASFHVYDGDRIVGFCAQKAFKLREDIRIYTDESKQEPLIHINARQILDFSAAYDIVDPRSNSVIGTARRKGFRSLLRDSWEILPAGDQPTAQLEEDSAGLALIRRFVSDLVPQSFQLKAGDRHVVKFKQRFNPFVYRLEVAIDQSNPIDRRLVFATAVLLAAIEGRQG